MARAEASRAQLQGTTRGARCVARSTQAKRPVAVCERNKVAQLQLGIGVRRGGVQGERLMEGKHVACGLGWATGQINGGSKGHAGGFWTHVLYRRVRERKSGDEIKGN